MCGGGKDPTWPWLRSIPGTRLGDVTQLPQTHRNGTQVLFMSLDVCVLYILILFYVCLHLFVETYPQYSSIFHLLKGELVKIGALGTWNATQFLGISLGSRMPKGEEGGHLANQTRMASGNEERSAASAARAIVVPLLIAG